MELRGRYFDGKTARAIPVEVRLLEDGSIELRISNYGNWRVEANHVKLGERLKGVPRRVMLPGDASIELNDDDAIDAWLRNARGRKGVGMLAKLESRWHIAIIAVALLVFVGWATYRYAIPAAAKPLAYAVPQPVADEIGRATLASLDSTLLQQTRTTPAKQAEIRQLLQEVSGGDTFNLQFRRFGAPNAFALPDGTIIVTDSLLEVMEPAKIQAILAHEIVHIRERHGLRMVISAGAVPVLIGFAIGDISSVLGAASALPTLLVAQSYSRGLESEADTQAIDILTKADLNPMNMARALEKFEQLAGDDILPSWLSSHPETKARIDEAAKKASAR